MSPDHDDGREAQRHIQAELERTLRRFGLELDTGEPRADNSAVAAGKRPARSGESRHTPTRWATGDPQTLPRGAVVGRLTILDRIGGGGQGDVYTAYDERLNRRVALKLIRVSAEHADAVTNTRLLREAQALARLDHPNVVRVHEAGIHEEAAYLVMEFKAQTSLARWMEEAPRRWQDIVAKFVAAGQGLRAAHEKNIVHRDFKAENVFVDAHVGAVLGDFGLAYGDDDDEPIPDSGPTESGSPPPPPRPSVLAQRLTEKGQYPGTPGYIASEAEHGRATALSDQYSFCVALFHALFGILPRPDERRRPSRPGDNPPARIVQILHRGLSKDPKARFPDMRALLAALDSRPSRHVVPFVLGAVLVAATAFWALLLPEPDPCVRAAKDKAEAVWNEDRRTSILAAFAGTDPSFAIRTGQSFVRFADGYSEEWQKEHAAACAAPSDAISACLENQLGRFEQLLTLYADPDPHLVVHALEAAENIGEPSECKASPLQEDIPDALRQELDRIELLIASRKLAEARIALDKIQAQASDVSGARIRMLLLEGWFGSMAAPDRASVELLKDAFHAAAAVSDFVTLRRASSGLLKTLVVDLEELDEAAESERWIRSFFASRPDALGGPQFQAELDEITGLRLEFQKEYAAAIEQHEKALQRREEEVFGPDHPLVAKSLHNLGLSLLSLSEVSEGRERDERFAQARNRLGNALKIRKEQYGEGHPLVAESVSALAQAECERLDARAKDHPGKHPDCLRDLMESLEIYRDYDLDVRGQFRRAIAVASAASTADCQLCFEEAFAEALAALDAISGVATHEHADLYNVRGKHANARKDYTQAYADFLAGAKLWEEAGRREEEYFQLLGNAAVVAFNVRGSEFVTEMLLLKQSDFVGAPCRERMAFAGMLDKFIEELRDQKTLSEPLQRAADAAREGCPRDQP